MKGWPLQPLEEIAELYGGSTPSRENPAFWGGDIPWVTPTDLPMPDEGISVVSRTKERITQAGLDNSSATVIPKGTVLFSSRATIGKVAVADMPLTTNQGFANFVPHSKVTSRFLAYALWVSREDIARLSGSTTFKEVSRSTLRKYQLPVPPLAEQERIVKLLDEADELRKLRSQADRRTADLIPALFHEMFGDPTTDSRGWPIIQLKDLTSRITKGESPAWQGFSYCSIGPAFITSENVRWGSLEFSQVKRIPGEFHQKLSRSKVHQGDVLVNLVGASIGRTCVVPTNIGEANVNQAVAVITVSTSLNAEYLCSALLMPASQDILHGGKVDAARANISLGDLRKFPLANPPLSLQEKFCGRVHEIRALEAKQADNRSRLDTLFQSMLHRAFRGEL